MKVSAFAQPAKMARRLKDAGVQHGMEGLVDLVKVEVMDDMVEPHFCKAVPTVAEVTNDGDGAKMPSGIEWEGFPTLEPGFYDIKGVGFSVNGNITFFSTANTQIKEHVAA